MILSIHLDNIRYIIYYVIAMPQCKVIEHILFRYVFLLSVFEMIIDLQEVAKVMQRVLIYFLPRFLMLASCIMVVQILKLRN